MIRNYLVVSLRNLRRNLLHSSIILMSLSTGIAACLIIYLFVIDELKFDSFHTQHKQIFRLNEKQTTGNGSWQHVALTGPPFGPGLKEEFPEVEAFTRVEEFGKKPLRVGDKQLLMEKGLLYVDSTFLDIFDFTTRYGERATMLDPLNSIVLTRSAALKFFDDEAEAVGKQIILGDEKTPYIVTGILDDVPEYSHIQFDGLVSFVTYLRVHPEYNTDWTGNWLYTYLQLSPSTNPAALEAKLPAWLIKWTESPDINKGFALTLQNLNDIHLDSGDIEHDYINYRKYSRLYLNVIKWACGFILLVAGINFINLTTARSSFRWKEIGVRKSIGAQRSQLFHQFIFESVFFAVLSLVIAVVMDIALLSIINEIIGRHLNLRDLIQGGQGLIIAGIAILVAIIAALYPAIYMSAVKAIKALKGKNHDQGRPVFQSALVVVQFAIAIGLIIGTLLVSRQLSFVKSEDLGFNKDEILLISMNEDANDKLGYLKNEMMKVPGVSGVTASSQRVGNNIHQRGFSVIGDKGLQGMFSSCLSVDRDYLNVYEIPMKEGRAFSSDVKTDEGNAIIINYTMAKQLALKEAIGVKAGYDTEKPEGNIIGVVDDFKYNSLHHKVNALSIVCNPSWSFSEMSVKIKGSNKKEAIEAIGKIWTAAIPNFPYEHSMLEDHFTNLYKEDSQLSTAVTIMASLSIFISCLGLFGLASLVTTQRTKEIGIRKILGATQLQIVALLTKSFVVLILVSFVLIVPVAYYLLASWLENFAYRISMDASFFLIGGSAALIIGFLTTSYHTLKTARTNPVKSLRHE